MNGLNYEEEGNGFRGIHCALRSELKSTQEHTCDRKIALPFVFHGSCVYQHIVLILILHVNSSKEE